MSKQLFKAFPEVSSKQWKQLIQADLKGEDYNETLIWKTNEGINVKPFYHADEFAALPDITASKATQWNICQTIFVASVSKSNAKAVDAIQRGAERIKFILPTEDISLKDLLVNINLSETAIYFELQFLNSEFVKALSLQKLEFIFNQILLVILPEQVTGFQTLKTTTNNLKL